MFFHFRNISWSETVIYLVLQLIVMNEFNTNPVLFDLFFDQGKIFNTCLNNMADLLLFFLLLYVQLNPYLTQSMVLYCVSVVVSMSLRMCSYHQRIFFLLSYFIFLYVKIIFPDLTLCQCLYVWQNLNSTNEIIRQIYIYIY